jgi:uncharacterized membrane protein YhaH (DUF805 family)
MNMAEFWTWYGTILIVAFVVFIGVFGAASGSPLMAAQLASFGVALAVLGASIFWAVVGSRRPR